MVASVVAGVSILSPLGFITILSPFCQHEVIGHWITALGLLVTALELLSLGYCLWVTGSQPR